MEPLKTTEEIAEYLRVEVVTVRRLATRGDLPAYRVGGEYRFFAQEIQDFVKSQRVSSGHVDASERFDKFTERALQVLSFANQEAAELGHNFVGTEHLLLGILREGEGGAAVALMRSGLNLQEVRQRMLTLMANLKQSAAESPTAQVKAALTTIIQGTGRATNPFGERPATGRVKKVLGLAVDEARRMDQRSAGTEHLLLGILKERQGPAAVVLVEQCGLALDATRELVLQIHKETSTMSLPEIPEQAATLLGENEQTVTCGRCGAQFPAYFRYCFHCGLKLP